MTEARFLIEYDQKINKQLDAARNLIDLNTVSGKNIDQMLSPLYREYGFLDGSASILDISPGDVPDEKCPLQNMKVDDALQKIGIDVAWLHAQQKNEHLTHAQSKQIHDIVVMYLKAKNILQHVIKTFGPIRYNSSGHQAHKLFLPLHWITDLEKAINGAKQMINNESQEFNKQLVEAVKEKIYKNPKDLTGLDRVAERFGVDVDTMRKAFVENVGETPSVYAQMILDEGVGDYLKHAAANVKNKVMSKVGVGQSKVAAQSKLHTQKGMDAILTKWTTITQGAKTSATPVALKSFLTSQLKMSPEAVDSVIKKYKKSFVKGVGESTSTVLEAYLPKNLLRDFFRDAINAQRMTALRPTAQNPAPNKPVAKPATQPVAPTPVATPAQATAAVKPAFTPKSQPAQAPASAPQQAPVQSTPVAKPTVDSFKQAITQLAPADRAAAITKALDTLTDDEIKQVLNTLLTRKP